MADTAGPIWLTYRAAAERLGMSPEAIAARARRRRWPKRIKNDTGEAEILVPAEMLAPRLKTGRQATSAAAPAPTVQPDIVALQAVLEPLTAMLERERTDRQTLQRQADDLRDQLARTRIDAAVATGMADLERQRREAAESRAADLERQLEAATRRRRWWWRR